MGPHRSRMSATALGNSSRRLPEWGRPTEAELVVVELDRGRPNDAPTRGAKPDAKIDIVVRNGKLLIETALRKENIAADRDTTRGYAGQILRADFVDTSAEPVSSTSSWA